MCSDVRYNRAMKKKQKNKKHQLVLAVVLVIAAFAILAGVGQKYQFHFTNDMSAFIAKKMR